MSKKVLKRKMTIVTFIGLREVGRSKEHNKTFQTNAIINMTKFKDQVITKKV